MKATSLIIGLLDDAHILLGVRAGSKPAVLTALARRASKLTGIAEPIILGALAAREALGSTGFGGGIAMPHARIEGLSGPIALFARLEKPTPFDAIDGKPVDLIVMLLSPKAADSDHLSALAAFSRLLRDQSIAAALRIATSAAAARALMAEGPSHTGPR